MPVETETVLMYVRVYPDLIGSSMGEIERRLESLGKILFMDETTESETSPHKIDLTSQDSKVSLMFLYHSKDGSHATVKIHRDGLINIDVQYSHLKGFQLESSKEFEDRVVECCGGRNVIVESNILNTGVRRGQRLWPYSVTADHRLIEADWDKIICNIDSPYQNIKIVNSKRNGHVLVLDDDIMIADSDLIYTTALCGVGSNQNIHREEYRDKEVLILGGGDGGILHELLKEKPKFITMAEIDDEVIKASKKHLRNVCFDALDRYEGVNHRIILDDCVKVLQDFISRGKRVDFVINDLTEYPVDKASKGHHYDFVTSNLIFELSVKILKPQKGKFLARGNCSTATDYHQRFEQDVEALGLRFNARKVFVPSFMEEYILYEVFQKKDTSL